MEAREVVDLINDTPPKNLRTHFFGRISAIENIGSVQRREALGRQAAHEVAISEIDQGIHLFYQKNPVTR
jgi:hypothetical protein